jgi:simple sugar transport system substrate-binding protein
MIRLKDIARFLKVATIIFVIPTIIFADPAITKVGFVYVGPIGDAGWTFQHDLARKQLERAFGNKLATQYVESVHEGADSERVIREMARSGCKVVFTTSFGYMNPTLKVARAFPNTVFMHATGYKTAHNVGIYNARFYEGRYLNGVMAGRMTKTNVAGIVAALPIPEVVMGINAFTRGMRSVNKHAKVKVIWTNSWFNPGREREAAAALIAQGADILTHHTDSTATIQVAEEKHVMAFGHTSDEAKYGPHAQLSGTMHIWGGFYIKIVKEVLAGKWKSASTWGGLGQNMVALAPFNAKVPKELRNQVIKLKGQIMSGKLHPFAGPVIDQTGRERVPAGMTMSDDELGGMNYFVQGVESKLPNT